MSGRSGSAGPKGSQYRPKTLAQTCPCSRAQGLGLHPSGPPHPRVGSRGWSTAAANRAPAAPLGGVAHYVLQRPRSSAGTRRPPQAAQRLQIPRPAPRHTLGGYVATVRGVRFRLDF